LRRRNSDAFDMYQQLAGPKTRGQLEAQMRSPDWQRMSRDEKLMAVGRIKMEARKEAREALLASE
jgi:hypothetical protein